MSDTFPIIFDQFLKLSQQLSKIRQENPSVDLTEASGLSALEIERIEKPSEEDLNDITLTQLSQYLFPLGYEVELVAEGFGKINPEASKITIFVKPIEQTVLHL